jgi:hypothetical protein
MTSQEISGERKKGVCEFGGESFEFGEAFRRGFELLLLAHEIMAVGADYARAQIAADQVCWLALDGEGVWPRGGEQRCAVPFSYADGTFIHWEGDNFNTARMQALENRDLGGC